MRKINRVRDLAHLSVLVHTPEVCEVFVKHGADQEQLEGFLTIFRAVADGGRTMTLSAWLEMAHLSQGMAAGVVEAAGNGTLTLGEALIINAAALETRKYTFTGNFTNRINKILKDMSTNE